MRLGRTLASSREAAVVEVFEGTAGLAVNSTRVRFLGRALTVPVSLEMLGRVFDGLGRPIDGGPEPLAAERRDINGIPLNPSARAYPREFIQTGISAIDGMNSLVRGQKLPIFSGSGMPHERLAAQIAAQATIGEAAEFSIVFAAMGIIRDVAGFFQRSFEESGALANSVLFLNLAEDPPPAHRDARLALTVAEYLAFDEQRHVLVILTDMTNYAGPCARFRACAAKYRRGAATRLYVQRSGLLYERCGRIEGLPGSIQLPIQACPTTTSPTRAGPHRLYHRGQIVLSRELMLSNIYPPIAVCPPSRG